MTTKKARKAWGTIALTILTLLVLNQVVSIARAAMEPTILTFENEPLNWDVRIEAESAKPEAEHMDEVKDGDLGKTEEGVAVQSSSPSEVVRMIEEKFGEKGSLVSAVFKAESGHNPRSMNWNCRYINERKETVSKACKPEDRDKAWSVDCGIAQINTVGKECPEELFEVEHNLAVAKKMYDARGLNPWMAYLNGSYKKHL